MVFNRVYKSAALAARKAGKPGPSPNCRIPVLAAVKVPTAASAAAYEQKAAAPTPAAAVVVVAATLHHGLQLKLVVKECGKKTTWAHMGLGEAGSDLVSIHC